MLLRKYDYKLQDYKVYNSPAETTVLYTQDMDTPIDCASCGKHMTYGDGYVSLSIHNYVGFGFPVCGECYDQEVKDEHEYRQR